MVGFVEVTGSMLSGHWFPAGYQEMPVGEPADMGQL